MCIHSIIIKDSMSTKCAYYFSLYFITAYNHNGRVM